MAEIFFGGPDRPPRFLRDLLQRNVESRPPGSRIDWATYYFRDRALARALIDASRRGVEVTLHIEGSPRRKGANDAVIAMLAEDGLGGGLHVHKPGRLAALHPHLHTKIYAFSDPDMALVGSFNPSGDKPEDREVTAEIGDQDRGHNLLVAYSEARLVEVLRAHVRGFRGRQHRFRRGRSLHCGPTSLYFYPRIRTAIIDDHLAKLGRGARIRGAISHLKQGFLTNALAGAVRRGAGVELLVHDTERRVPEATVRSLTKAGISVRRYSRPDGLPMHAKFLLVDAPEGKTLWFGSFNFNPRSRYLNHEILVRSGDPFLWSALDERFEEIAREIAARRPEGGEQI